MDKTWNEEMRKKLEIFSTEDKIKEYKIRWLEHLQRISPRRIPKQAYMFSPKGRRNMSRPRKRWKSEAGTGHTPSP
jgi:hypothetical protein